MDDRTELNRLRWHSRRGMLVIDVMFMPFTQHEYLNLSTNDQKAYRRLLDCEDQDIWEWLRGFRLPDDQDLARIVLLVRQASGDLSATSPNRESANIINWGPEMLHFATLSLEYYLRYLLLEDGCGN